jgi:HAD superfamily hydrolase (TIGR01484 family)
MRPLGALNGERAGTLRGLLFDLDDTVLDHGRLTRPAFEALERLAESNLLLVAVTGRPVAWGQLLVRQWPLAGMVAENGNISVHATQGRSYLMDPLSPETRAARTRQLGDLSDEMRSRWPVLVRDDGLGRVTDVAFDVAEHHHVADDVVRAATDFARARGARTSVSSIHLHVTFDTEDKATGALRYLSLAHEVDPTEALHSFAYVGDSENDAPAFAAFECSIGVANVRGRWTRPPAFVTAGARGVGFREAADHLLRLRR